MRPTFQANLAEVSALVGAVSATRTAEQFKSARFRTVGTGRSSLSYLRRFRIDILKIDQAFVRDIAPGEDGAAIVRRSFRWHTACDWK